MVVESVRVSVATENRVVVLKEKSADRFLLIWIGPLEAWAIASVLQGVSMSRPYTHDLLKVLVHEMGGKVSQVVVNDLKDDTYYARIIIDANGRHVEVDSRPSDAIALAVRVKAPIFVEERVLQSAALVAESEESKASSPAQDQMSEADKEKLKAFRDVIEGLDTLDDLGQQR